MVAGSWIGPCVDRGIWSWSVRTIVPVWNTDADVRYADSVGSEIQAQLVFLLDPNWGCRALGNDRMEINIGCRTSYGA